MRTRRILFVYPWPDQSFIRKDEQLLGRHFQLRVLHWSRNFQFYKQLIWILWRREVDLVYLWFLLPDYAALTLALARRAGIPLVLVTGGYDVASIPAIRFGNMRKLHHRLQGRWVLGLCDLILPFSDFAGGEVLRWAQPRGRMVTLYPGIDAGYFTPPATGSGRSGVITVGKVNPLFNVQKGLLGLARASRAFPDVPFTILGTIQDPAAAEQLRREGGPNLAILDRRLSDDELRDWYRKSSVYAQLSAHEGFGIAVAEAMACGCTPVVCRGTASPEVVGPHGQQVDFGDLEGTVSGIRRALSTANSEREAGRERIRTLFPPERRERELLELLP